LGAKGVITLVCVYFQVHKSAKDSAATKLTPADPLKILPDPDKFLPDPLELFPDFKRIWYVGASLLVDF